MFSRGWYRYQKFVSAPMSTRFAPRLTQWSMIRENSERIVRTSTPRSGISTPSILSTVLTYPTPLIIEET